VREVLLDAFDAPERFTLITTVFPLLAVAACRLRALVALGWAKGPEEVGAAELLTSTLSESLGRLVCGASDNAGTLSFSAATLLRLAPDAARVFEGLAWGCISTKL